MAEREVIPTAPQNSALGSQTGVKARTENKGVSRVSANPSPEFPLTIAEWDRNAREVIRVSIDRFRDKPTVSVRLWYRDGGQLLPGAKGLTVAARHLPQLVAAFAQAVQKALEVGLLGAGQ